MQEQLFASFMLDNNKGMEIALRAESVTEATPITGTIQDLPATVDYLEGIMHLRDKVIPIINLKKRFGFSESNYGKDAKVAVVDLFNQQYGLLFDDIKEVFRAESTRITPVSPTLQTEDKIISALIQMEEGQRTVELMDLSNLFSGKHPDLEEMKELELLQKGSRKQSTYSRWVVFVCDGQEYGVPVQCSQEITFLHEIDDMFKSGNVEGALKLRGNTIPVLNSRSLLSSAQPGQSFDDEKSRVLVLNNEECSFGMMVEEVKEIMTIADDKILSVTAANGNTIKGVYQREEGINIMLLHMENLISNQVDEIESLARINKDNGEDTAEGRMVVAKNHHVITENCYLIFSIDMNLAIELKDVREIIECTSIMNIPGVKGYNSSVINLRGEIVPVVNIRKFYGYPDANSSKGPVKLIICKAHSRAVALEVDKIVTIYKQEQFHTTPSLNPRLAEKKDTLDRLIEFAGGAGIKEHVLVVNIHNIIRNYLETGEELTETMDELQEENK